MVPLELIECNIRSEFHLIRHFQSLDEEVVHRLLSVGYTEDQINKELSVTGSRFRTEFANSAAALIRRFGQHASREEPSVNSNRQWVFSANSSEFPQGIGTMAVASIEELDPEAKGKILPVDDRPEKVYYAEVAQLPVAFEFSVILKPLGDRYLLLSAFPGGISMPLPDVKMTAREYQLSREFWNRHVFLRIRSGAS